MTRAKARPPHSRSSPQTVPLSMPGARQLGWPLRLPPLELVGTRPPQKRWLRRLNLLRLKRLHIMTKTTCSFACRGRRWRQWITGSSRWCSTRFPKELGHRMQHLFFTPLRCSRRQPRHSRGDSGTIYSARVAVVQPGRCGETIVNSVENEPHVEVLTQHLATSCGSRGFGSC